MSNQDDLNLNGDISCNNLTVRGKCIGCGGGGGGNQLLVGPVMFFGFNAAANTLYPLTGNHEINGNIFLPLAADAGNGALCGFKLYGANFGPVWRVFPTGGDQIDTGSYNFPDNNTGDYVEFISDGVGFWFLRTEYLP